MFNFANAISPDGTFVDGAGVWTSTGGIELTGAPGGGCGSSLSHLFGMDADGDTAVGMAWVGCRTSPMLWQAVIGPSLMVKQTANQSARANRVSGDGLVAVGWDQGLPNGASAQRRASVRTDPITQTSSCSSWSSTSRRCRRSSSPTAAWERRPEERHALIR